jgi:hypothetical protein
MACYFTGVVQLATSSAADRATISALGVNPPNLSPPSVSLPSVGPPSFSPAYLSVPNRAESAAGHARNNRESHTFSLGSSDPQIL